MNHLETRNVLIDKIIKTYELDTKDIADVVELYYDCQELRIKHANRERTEGLGELFSWIAGSNPKGQERTIVFEKSTATKRPPK